MAFSKATCLRGRAHRGAPLLLLLAAVASAQDAPPSNVQVDAVQQGDMQIWAVEQDFTGDVRHLRGHAEIRINNVVVTADEIDHDEATGALEARGNVRYHNLSTEEDLHAEKIAYNTETGHGTFYNVHGTVSSASQATPRALTTDNPFFIEGKVVHKVQDHYTVHNGFVHNCEVKNPWWTLRSPRTDIVPGDKAVVRRGVFRLRGVPLFYFPYFNKSLKRLPRQSGFLTPNFGNSSRFGFVLGQSYYWAINRSYDATIGGTWFTDRGLATQIGFRGRPTANSTFNASFYGVNDRGFKRSDGTRADPQGGGSIKVEGAALMPGGFRGVVNLNYLSSLEFRQAFTESFEEAVFSQVRSIGFISKNVSSFSMNVSLLRDENFQSVRPDDTVIIRNLPSMEFNSHDRQLLDGPLPLWFSLDSSFGLVSRTQPTFQTRRFVQRGDFFPRVTSTFRLKDFQFTPTFGARQTAYGQRREQDEGLIGQNLYRNNAELSLDIVPPSLQRIYEGPKWLGDRVKHVIEPRVRYRYVTGVDNFGKVIRFDERDLVTNTNEADISITNRLYAKDDRTGGVREVFSLEIWQRRYFDPSFDGAVVPGARNVFRSTIDVSPFAFLDQARRASPVVTSMRARPTWRHYVEWRNDFDPLRDKLVNSSANLGYQLSDLWNFEVGHHVVRSTPTLTPTSNQLSTLVRFGHFNRRGWNAAIRTLYDYRQAIFIYHASQASYNTDCCGFSFEWRRFAIGRTREENQFRVSLSIANVGSFGTLSPRERLF